MSSSNGSTSTALVRRWRRGDRVARLAGGGAGIVEGWRGELLLVLWGVFDTRPVRTWEPAAELVFLDGGPPYVPSSGEPPA